MTATLMVSSALTTSAPAGGNTVATSPALADDRARFRSLVSAGSGKEGQVTQAAEQPPAAPNDATQFSRWVDHTRDDFSHTMKRVSEIVAPEGALAGSPVQLLLETQLDVLRVTIQIDVMTHVGSKGMQNFETFLKNQG
jgi:hypothetical protein